MWLKGFLGALKCVSYYFCNSIFWSQDHRPVLEKYPHSMLHSPVMLSKCMVAMAKTNKTKHLRQEKEVWETEVTDWEAQHTSTPTNGSVANDNDWLMKLPATSFHFALTWQVQSHSSTYYL